MLRLLVLLIFAALLSGCAGTLPLCDGTDRRPINTPARADAVHVSCANTA